MTGSPHPIWIFWGGIGAPDLSTQKPTKCPFEPKVDGRDLTAKRHYQFLKWYLRVMWRNHGNEFWAQMQNTIMNLHKYGYDPVTKTRMIVGASCGVEDKHAN